MDIIKVRILKPEEYHLWDKLVEISANGTIFQTSQWLITAGFESQVKTELFGAFSHDQLVGGCAIHFHKIAGIFTSATTTLPLTPYGGIILRPHESTKIREREKDEWLIINSLLNDIQHKNPHILSLTLSPQVIDIRPYAWQGWDESVRYCYIFQLTGNIAEHISKNVRRSVNKAKKSGIVTRQKWDKDLYWDLTLNTYRKQGTKPPFSQKFLFLLIDKIQENRWGEMWIAETASGDVAAAEIAIWDHQMAYRWSAASHDHYKDTGATSFLLLEIMTHLQEKGFEKFNIMAANTLHLAKFISSFNPELVPYYSVKKSRGIFCILDAMRSITRRG
jgi:hypothetical protein